MKPQILDIGKASKLFCVQTDRFKSELLSMQFFRPILAETVQLNAMLPAVLRRGTTRHPSKQALSRHLDDLYSTLISMHNRRLGDLQNIRFTADFLGARYLGGKSLLGEVTAALGEILFTPLLESGRLSAAFVDSEREHLRDAIRATINNPRAFAAAECRKLLCAGEPYALSLRGEEETLDAMTPEALTAHYRAFLGQSAPYFYYVGAEDPQTVARHLEGLVSGLSDIAPTYQSKITPQTGREKRAEREMPLCQGKLALGFRTEVSVGHELAPALMLFNEIFGGSPASKLFLNVREKRGLCYHCSASLDLYKGVILANAGMTPENRQITEQAMLDEFAAMQQGDITLQELDAARSSLDHAYRQLFDAPSALCNFYAGRLISGNNVDIDEWRERMMSVTRDDVVAVAQRVALGAVFFLNGTLAEEVDEND